MGDMNDAVQRGLQVVAALPEEVHWLCERVEPGPSGKTIIPTEDFRSRADSTIHALLLLSFSDQDDSQVWLKMKIGEQLTRCAQCVAEFYVLKSRLYYTLLPDHGKENLDQFWAYLSDWDIERITPPLQEVVDDLDATPSVDQWYANLRRENRCYNAVYECLCSREMLRSEAVLTNLRRVVSTGKLEIDGYPCGMIWLLFHKEREFRMLAERTWVVKGPSMTSENFENTLLEFLELATGEVEQETDPVAISRFFRGLTVIVRSVSRDVIMKCIAGARHDGIKLAVQRIQPNCPYWSSLLPLFDSLMKKLKKEFWDTVSPLSSSAFPEVVFNDQAYQKLIRETEQGPNGEKQLLELTEWTSTYMTTISPLTKPTAAQPLTQQLLRPDLPPLTKGISLKEGMKVLNSTLSDVQQELSQVEGEANVMIVRHVNQLINAHLRLVSDIAFSNPNFDDKMMETHMRLAQGAAKDAVASILRLDLRLLEADYSFMARKRPEKPLYAMSTRRDLWRSLYNGLCLDDVPFVKRIIVELKELFAFEPLRVAASDPLRLYKDQFESTLKELEVEVSRVFKRLMEMPQTSLGELLQDRLVLEVVLGCTLLSAREISMACEDIQLKASNADTETDALRNMCKSDLWNLLHSVNQIGRWLASPKGLFKMTQRWIKFSATLVDVLCDRFHGVIRKMDDLEEWGKTALRCFWETQWRCLARIFKACRRWALVVDKDIMKEFCRDSMDYAQTLFDNFWAFEQALRGNSLHGEDWKPKLLLDSSKALSTLTSILSIQDDHLLQTCQALMCRILKLLAQEETDIEGEGFYVNMKKILYPELFPDYDPRAPPTTNLNETQRGELLAAISQLRPDFVPPPKEKPFQEKTIIELSEDEDGGIADDDLLKAEEAAVRKASKPVQTKLGFPVLPSGSRPSTPKPVVVPTKQSALRLGTSRPKVERDDQKRKAFLEKRKAEQAAREAQKAAVLGNKPKVQGADPDVSSEDSAASSDDDDGNSLFKIGSKTKLTGAESKVIPEAPRKMVSRPRTAPSKLAKDNRARIAPDLSPLYKQIFAWDFFHQGEFPPGLSASNYTHVAKSFKSYAAYQKTFEPLLLLEAWQSFLVEKENAKASDRVEVKIATRMRADNFVELETTVLGLSDFNRWMESDVVLLSSSSNPLRDPTAPHCIARVFNVRKKWHGAPSAEVTLRCDPPPKMLQDHMRNGGTLHGLKISNLITLEREYTAMICLQYYGLRDEIINGRLNEVPVADETSMKRTRTLYDVNEPQARAILAAISNDGFTLIQGPPGTGKTKTVTGIVGAALTPGGEVINIPGATQKAVRKKILVCAPSNAAVDELVLRFKQGVKTARGALIKPFVVRIGRSDAINSEVKDVTMEELIDARMSTQKEEKAGSAADNEALRQKHEAMVQDRNQKQKRLDDARSNKQEPPPGLLGEVDELNNTLRQLRRQLDEQRDRKKETSRNAELIRRRIQQQIMDEAQIICATLSGTGHEMLRNVNVDFETVIIDEAAQSVELSALIPLKFGCEKCILVGDPQQLPPTVLSRAAAKFSYEKSLFVRIQENHPKAVNLLSIQYRMHPMISVFPSKEFYDSALRDGEGMAEIRKQPWHSSSIFGPYRFFSVSGREATGGRSSLINVQEANTALMLYDRLTSEFSGVQFAGRVGIITPYRQQKMELMNRFKSRYGEGILNSIEFNTADAFQGRERDIIIFSCVRASEEGGIGFLADVRRMNVGLTRAKSSLFVLGNAQYLVRNKLWRGLIDDAKERKLFTEGNMNQIFNNSLPVQTRTPLLHPQPAVAAQQQVQGGPMRFGFDVADPRQKKMVVPAAPAAPMAMNAHPPRRPSTGPSAPVMANRPSAPIKHNNPVPAFGSPAIPSRPANGPRPPVPVAGFHRPGQPSHHHKAGRDPGIPTVQATGVASSTQQALKRPVEDGNGPGNYKRPHLDENRHSELPAPTSTSAIPVGTNRMNDRMDIDPPQKLPVDGPSKKVKRKGKTDPFHKQKKHKKHGDGGPPQGQNNLTMREARERAAANTLAQSGRNQ